MFDITCLKQEPLILQVSDVNKEAFVHPMPKECSHSDWMMYAMDEDGIDMIYAMQCRPWFDYIAFKVKYKSEPEPTSEIIHRPELCFLKRIWDLGHKDFNDGIKFYCKYSSNTVHQFSNKDKYMQNANAWKWYTQVILGRLD